MSANQVPPAQSPVLSSPAVQRVAQSLRAANIAGAIVELPGAAKTAKAAAEFLGCDLAQIANSLVFQGEASGAPILVMSSGARRVDLARLATFAGEGAGRASPDFVRAHTGFAIGGVAPTGHLTPMRVFVERSLAAHERIWAAAGHPNTVFPLTYAELLHLTGGMEIDAAS